MRFIYKITCAIKIACMIWIPSISSEIKCALLRPLLMNMLLCVRRNSKRSIFVYLRKIYSRYYFQNNKTENKNYIVIAHTHTNIASDNYEPVTTCANLLQMQDQSQ